MQLSCPILHQELIRAGPCGGNPVAWATNEQITELWTRLPRTAQISHWRESGGVVAAHGPHRAYVSPIRRPRFMGAHHVEPCIPTGATRQQHADSYRKNDVHATTTKVSGGAPQNKQCRPRRPRAILWSDLLGNHIGSLCNPRRNNPHQGARNQEYYDDPTRRCSCRIPAPGPEWRQKIPNC